MNDNHNQQQQHQQQQHESSTLTVMVLFFALFGLVLLPVFMQRCPFCKKTNPNGPDNDDDYEDDDGTDDIYNYTQRTAAAARGNYYNRNDSFGMDSMSTNTTTTNPRLWHNRATTGPPLSEEEQQQQTAALTAIMYLSASGGVHTNSSTSTTTNNNRNRMLSLSNRDRDFTTLSNIHLMMLQASELLWTSVLANGGNDGNSGVNSCPIRKLRNDFLLHALPTKCLKLDACTKFGNTNTTLTCDDSSHSKLVPSDIRVQPPCKEQILSCRTDDSCVLVPPIAFHTTTVALGNNDRTGNVTICPNDDDDEENPDNPTDTCGSSSNDKGMEDHDDDDDENDYNNCLICLTEYRQGNYVSCSPNSKCNHVFHRDCIVEWLLTHDECPCCRNDFLDFNHDPAENDAIDDFWENNNNDGGVTATTTFALSRPPPISLDSRGEDDEQETNLTRGMQLFQQFSQPLPPPPVPSSHATTTATTERHSSSLSPPP